jgi:hypothetical protein
MFSFIGHAKIKERDEPHERQDSEKTNDTIRQGKGFLHRGFIQSYRLASYCGFNGPLELSRIPNHRRNVGRASGAGESNLAVVEYSPKKD